MKKLFIIANWKANKTISEAEEWLQKFTINDLGITNKEIVLCPPLSLLSTLKSYILNHNSPIRIGAQNVSKYQNGAYTGEVTAEMLKGLVQYCIVGHSERRKFFNETDDDVIAKIGFLLELNITPILCISNFSQLESYVDRGKQIIERAKEIVFVYEPPEAISGGGDYKPESPEVVRSNVIKIKNTIKNALGILYGGSINSTNVSSFFSLPEIDGGLVGQASLDSLEFLQIIKNA